MPTLKAKNPAAELQFKARGNPPQAHPEAAVGNFFPGLEFNFQNVWKRFFIGVELLEYGGRVIAVDEAAVDASGGDTTGADGARLRDLVPSLLVSIDGIPTYQEMKGPLENAQEERGTVMLEWSNLLAETHAKKGGTAQTVECIFYDGKPRGPFRLKVRRLLELDSALISREASLPGEITESLCSPWQTDYIGCACYYWASNRPDYVNIDQPEGDTTGNNWLDKARLKRPDGKPLYTLQEANLLQHTDVMQDWESKFQFVVAGRDVRDGVVPAPPQDGKGP
jgi:hypothetical protein